MPRKRAETEDKKQDRQQRAQHIREKLAERMGGGGEVPLEDLTEVMVASMYIVQKLGKAFKSDVLNKLAELKAAVDEDLVAQALEALRARQLLSYASGRKNGAHGTAYKPRQAMWGRVPEVAHIIDLLPQLVATKEAEQIMDVLGTDEHEAEREEERKPKSKKVYDDFVSVRADFITITPLVGSQPDSPYLRKMVKNSKYNDVEADLRFSRSEDGQILINSDVVQGWLRTGLRTLPGLGDSAAQYIGCSDIKLSPKKLHQHVLPVIDQRTRQGKGLNSYETIDAGERLSIYFRLPTRGVLTADQFKAWLAGYAPNPQRGLSPARGARYGKMAMVGFENLGKVADAAAFIGAAMEQIPEEAREFYKDLMKEVRGVTFRRGTNGHGAEEEADAAETVN